jgi:hypothetical protein
MHWPTATPYRRRPRRQEHGAPGERNPTRWYVGRALGEETAIGENPLPASRGPSARVVSLSAFAVLALVLSACGDDNPRQDADEPSADFPVAVDAAKFPTDQRLADTQDLRLEIENTGTEPVPNLAVTIYTGEEKAGGSFAVRSDQAGLANPNRPVWILENGFPKLATTPGEAVEDLELAASAGAEVAQTDTFAFGPLDPGDIKDIVWRVTPVQAGTYTVHYELAAGLNGKARAVAEDGSPVEGEFVVTISSKPPRASVDAAGNVVIEKP